jgi:DNA polymerase-1
VNAVQCSWQGRVDIGCGRIVKAEWEVENGGRITFNQACNLPIQGVCADLMLRALGTVHTRLAGIAAHVVAVVHDEVLVEASEHDADRAKAILEESMVEAFEVTFPGAPRRGVAAGGIGPTWLGAKPG